MTQRLYYTDSSLTEFDATVAAAHDSAVVLDRTAFYPTSGGQLCDTGVLESDGVRLRVTEVTENDSGEILHLADRPVAVGARVHGIIDAPRRRDHMQQHTGQHVLSAAFIKLYSMPTVSFHMGAESCTIDLDAKTLTPAQVEAAEALANQIVTEDRPVEIRFVSLEEARGLGLRKLPDLDKGELRLIHIRDFDLTACGGTHVRCTGQIGAILLRKTEKVKQGVRVEFVCGDRAIRTARRDYSTLNDAAALLSAHIWDLPQQVRKSLDETKGAGKERQHFLEEIAELHAARLLAETPASAGFKLIARAFAGRDLAFIKLLAQKITKSEPSVALLVSTGGHPAMVFSQSAGLLFDMGALMKETMAKLGGRGGGTRDLAQGGAPGASHLEAALTEAAAKLRDANAGT